MTRQFSHFGSGGGRGGDRVRVLIIVGVLSVVLFTSLGFLLVYSGSSTATTKAPVVEKEAEIKMVNVLVPIQAIEAGTALEPQMFRTESRPQVGLSQRVVKDFEEIKGHFSRSLVVPDQPLHRDYITNVRPTNALTVKIPEGFRAVTISVDAKSSVEGWARPGARVDVVWASRIQGQPGVTVIVQNAQVLSAQQQMTQDIKANTPPPSTVTLLVTAADAQRIHLAQTTGSLSLSLRGDSDNGAGSAEGSLVLENLLGGGRQNSGRADVRQGVVKMRDRDGRVSEWVLKDGKLTPVED